MFPNHLIYCDLQSISRTFQLALSVHAVWCFQMIGIILRMSMLYKAESEWAWSLPSICSQEQRTWKINQSVVFQQRQPRNSSQLQHALRLPWRRCSNCTPGVYFTSSDNDDRYMSAEKRIGYLATICLQLCMPACRSTGDYYDYFDPGPLQEIQYWTLKPNPNLPSICSPRLLVLFTSAWD